MTRRPWQGAILCRRNIENNNPFDQWAVELGKVPARRIIPQLESKEHLRLEHDSSTNSLICRYRQVKRAANE